MTGCHCDFHVDSCVFLGSISTDEVSHGEGRRERINMF